MARIGRSAEDWDYLFSEFEFLLSFGMHPEHAVRQLDYPSVAALFRAYQRAGREVPQPLLEESAWLQRARWAQAEVLQ